jgi:uncharacterized Zn finger protein
MSWYQDESSEERKASVQRDLERRRKRGEEFVPLVVPQGSRKLVSTFWGKAWCQHLEKFQDYEYRLPRGRSYLRQGLVYNLSVDAGLITAQVSGSSMYEVSVRVAPLQAEAWTDMKAACAGQVGSLLDLLSGNLGTGVMAVICDRDKGIFPTPREIKMSCTCPDWADMCKHVAAVMYGVGVKFDSDGALFFRLRQVDPADLMAVGAGELLAGGEGTGDGLSGEDLSALFGIDLSAAEEEAPQEEPPKRPREEIPTLVTPTPKKKKPPAPKAAKAAAEPRTKPKATKTGGTSSKK